MADGEVQEEKKFYANSKIKFLSDKTGEQIEVIYQSINDMKNQKATATQIFPRMCQNGQSSGKFDAFIYYIVFKEKGKEENVD